MTYWLDDTFCYDGLGFYSSFLYKNLLSSINFQIPAKFEIEFNNSSEIKAQISLWDFIVCWNKWFNYN